MINNYIKSLRLAGATIHKFRAFGSYQGSWWAKITYEGRTGWVHGNFGSCSTCDAFDAEFGYFNCDDHDSRNDDNFVDDCNSCAHLETKFVLFGKEYIDNMCSQEKAEEIVKEDIEWDMTARVMLGFICGELTGPYPPNRVREDSVAGLTNL